MWFSSRRKHDLERRLDVMERLLAEVLVTTTDSKWKVHHMLNVLQAVAAQVARSVTLETSLVTLVKALGAQISQNASDATFIQTLGDHLQDLTNANDLAAAVLVGTPQDPNAAPAAPTPAVTAEPAAAPAATPVATENAPAAAEPAATVAAEPAAATADAPAVASTDVAA